jgi:AraC-like DNA-binding protein
MLSSLEVQIAAMLLRDIKADDGNMPGCLPDTESYIRRASDYMRAYYNSNITIEDICGEIHVSPFHFIRMFKQRTGITPHQFLLRMRIEKARELLSSGRYSISETASACGFVSIAHFYEKFKAVTGVPPGNYKF